MNSLIQWLAEANSRASGNRDISVLVDGINRQIEQFKVCSCHSKFQNFSFNKKLTSFFLQPLVEEVESKRQSVNELEKNSFEHKSNSEKQEMAMIKNLVLDMKHRYEEIVKKVRDHNKRLEEGSKRAKQV